LENLNGRDHLQGLNIDKGYEDNIKMNIEERQYEFDYGDSEYHQKTVISAESSISLDITPYGAVKSTGVSGYTSTPSSGCSNRPSKKKSIKHVASTQLCFENLKS
jgi:hypothetical protein